VRALGFLRAGVAALFLLLPLPTRAEGSDGFFRGIIARAAEGAKHIYHEGRSDLYLSGAYWHLPFEYSSEDRERLNDRAWGAGLGRRLVDIRDNEESLYALTSSSSHFQPQYVVGYAWLARWRLSGEFRVGAGYTAFIFARSDIYHYFPLPGIAPIASLGTDRINLLVGYLPGIRNGITGRGNVLYALCRIGFD
jgi:palmitoyl transferase